VATLEVNLGREEKNISSVTHIGIELMNRSYSERFGGAPLEDYSEQIHK
jgi:hypothetical protein